MELLYVILLILTIVGFLFGSYYIVAFILLWPRLLAKYFYKKEKDVKKIRRTKTILIILELFFCLVSFFLSYVYSFEFFQSILYLSLIAGGGVLVFEIFVYDLFPRVLGLTLVGSPPIFVIREVTVLWVVRFFWVPTIAILFALIIASHIVGIFLLLLGIIVTIKFNKYIRKDEDTDKLDEYISSLKDEVQKDRILSAIMLGEIGDEKATQPLIKLLKHQPYLLEHTHAVRSLGKIADTRAVPTLFNILGKKDSANIRDEVIKALVKISRNDMTQLINALKSRHPDIRSGAAEALEKSNWKPKTDIERIYFLTVKQRWKEVEKFGSDSIDALVLSLRGADVYTKKKILKLLKKIGWEPTDNSDLIASKYSEDIQ